MSITAEITVTLAEVEVTDDYRVELRQHEPAVTYTWTEAEQLANELITAVEAARAALRDDFPVPNLAEKFDVLPICRDCAEEKHGACIGSAYLENEFDVDEVECGCSAVDHQVHGGAA